MVDPKRLDEREQFGRHGGFCASGLSDSLLLSLRGGVTPTRRPHGGSFEHESIDSVCRRLSEPVASRLGLLHSALSGFRRRQAQMMLFADFSRAA
jgi:hypothetical protein